MPKNKNKKKMSYCDLNYINCCTVCATPLKYPIGEQVCSKCNRQSCCDEYETCECHQETLCSSCFKTCRGCYEYIICKYYDSKCYSCGELKCLRCLGPIPHCEFCNRLICITCINYTLYSCERCNKHSCDECRNSYGSNNMGMCPNCQNIDNFQLSYNLNNQQFN